MLETLGTGTILATVMVFAFGITNALRLRRGGKFLEPASRNVRVCCALIGVAGATTANGLFHFAHGILGYSDFPAPFAEIFGSPFFSGISNVIWGLINFSVAILITLSYRKSVRKWVFAACSIGGFVLISYLLRFVFLDEYFQTHAF